MLSAHPSENTQNPSTTSDLPKVYSIPIAPEALAHYSRELNLEPNAALSALAYAIASSPNWLKIPETVFIVRSTPQPALGVLGCFDEAKEVEIQIQLKSLSRDLARLRYVSYQRAELNCQHLATQLVERFGSKELQRFQFTGIPRGGLIVMGMLAYALKLKPEQLEPSTKKDVPLVVVDDCVFTGSRLSYFLQCNPDRKVVFAHLYSHPELRANILATEPNVIDCLSACDIKDYAPEDLGNNYSTWRSHSLANLNGTRYWVGKTDRIGFAWNEPDRFFWNPLTQKMEASWLLVPKELCLKNRFKAVATHTAVQIQAETSSAIKLASSVIFGQYGKQVIIGNLHTQQSFGLNDLAADIWLAVVKYGNLEQVITALLQKYDVDEATLRVDVSAFINQLFQQGLLQN